MTNVNRRTILKAAGATAAVSAFGFPALVRAEGAALKIGQLGVMSGPEASWGLVNKFSALAVAELWNEKGGVEIDGTLRRVEIVSVDDRNDTKLSVLGAERLASEEGIRYIIGPNTDATALSVRPIAEKNGAMYFPYAFNPEVYRAPASNAVLGMITSYQIAPLMYKILKEQRGVGKAAFLARNDADGLARREEVAGVLGGLGVEVVAKDAYETSVTDFFPVVSNVVATKPDVIIMSSVASAHAPQIMRAAREMGYEGLFSCESGQDIKIINEVAGEYGNGLVSVGGASTPEIRSEYMEKFIEQYVKVAGEWNDEAGTKVYAPEIILATLQKAGAKAIDDIEAYKAVMPDFSVKNPFLKEESALTYVGMADFGQKRQIGVPMVITETKGGEFTTLAIGKVAS